MINIRYYQMNITPLIPLHLAGFDFRNSYYEKVGEDIYLSCMILENRYIILSLDCLWWGDTLCEDIKRQLKKRLSAQSFDIIFHATHSHSGPQLQRGLSHDLGEVCDEYLGFLTDKSLEAIEKALSCPVRGCRISEVNAECDFAVYRRKKNDRGEMIMAPNFHHTIDKTIRLTLFHQDKNIAAIWIHFQCHPAMTGDNILSGDYPTSIRRYMQKKYPMTFIQMMQGFCADIRPHFDKKNLAFIRLSFDEMQQRSKNLAQKLCRIIDEGNWKDLEGEANVYMRHCDFRLPLEKVYSPEELYHIKKSNSSKIKKEWAEYFLNHPKKKKNDLGLSLSFFHLHRELSLLAINAEVANEFARNLLKKYPDLLPLGYSNGITGYIPTDVQLTEGGYEAEDSIYYFRMPAKFSHNASSLFYEYCHQIIQGK